MILLRFSKTYINVMKDSDHLHGVTLTSFDEYHGALAILG